MSAEGGRGPRHSVPRASVVNIGGDFSTVVLVDINNRPIMNLHKVPQHVCVSNVKKKISDRLREVGRNLPADLMYVGSSLFSASSVATEPALKQPIKGRFRLT